MSGEMSHEEIASRVGVSRVRVGQIERAAFAKMRRVVLESDDFPLLREAFAGLGLEARVAAEGEEHRRRLEKFAAMCRARGERR